MSKHIFDRIRTRKGERLKRYTTIEALAGAAPRKQAQLLRRMPRGLDNGERMRRYLRLARTAG